MITTEKRVDLIWKGLPKQVRDKALHDLGEFAEHEDVGNGVPSSVKQEAIRRFKLDRRHFTVTK